MKPLKRAKQQDVGLNTDYYTAAEIDAMYRNLEIDYLDKSIDPVRICPVIFTEDITNLKIVLDEFGYYTTVAVKNGKEYFIKL